MQQERDALNAELGAWRAAHPALDDTTLAQLLQMDDALLAEARQRLQQNAETLTRCRERLDGCLNRLASHQQQQAEVPEAEQLQQAHAEQLHRCEQAEQRCAETRPRCSTTTSAAARATRCWHRSTRRAPKCSAGGVSPR